MKLRARIDGLPVRTGVETQIRFAPSLAALSPSRTAGPVGVWLAALTVKRDKHEQFLSARYAQLFPQEFAYG